MRKPIGEETIFKKDVEEIPKVECEHCNSTGEVPRECCSECGTATGDDGKCSQRCWEDEGKEEPPLPTEPCSECKKARRKAKRMAKCAICACGRKIKPGASCFYLPSSRGMIIAVCVPCGQYFRAALTRGALNTFVSEAEAMEDDSMKTAAELLLDRFPTSDVGTPWEPPVDAEEIGKPVVADMTLSELRREQGDGMGAGVLAARARRSSW